jgi:hypothetical protein
LIVCERDDDDDRVLSCHEVRGVVEGRAVVIAGRASIDLGPGDNSSSGPAVYVEAERYKVVVFDDSIDSVDR